MNDSDWGKAAIELIFKRLLLCRNPADDLCLHTSTMDDYLQRYLPEYDPEAERLRLLGFAREELLELLLRAYKEKRVLAKLLDELYKKQERIRHVLDEPTQLASMPGIPGPDDLRKLME